MRARDRMRKEDITRLREQVVAILRSQEEGEMVRPEDENDEPISKIL